MPSNLFDSPGFVQTVMEELPIGIYIVDREQTIHFWNRGAEHIVGHLSQEVVGRKCSDHIIEACDRYGLILSGEKCPVIATLRDGQSRELAAHYLHKEGHRVPVKVRSRPIIRNRGVIEGALIVFETAMDSREGTDTTSMYGFLDAATEVPAHRLTRAFLCESMAAMAESHHGFGLLRVRVLGLDEFRSKHGLHSVIPHLRTTAHTLRHSLDPRDFLGRWGEDEFIAVLPSANPASTAAAAKTVWNLVTHSEVRWWGDRFPVQAVVTHTMAKPGDQLEKLLNGLEPTHAAAAGRAVGAMNAAVAPSPGAAEPRRG